MGLNLVVSTWNYLELANLARHEVIKVNCKFKRCYKITFI